MDFSIKLLGSSLRDLRYENIVTFFEEEKVETDLIEFKSFSTKGNLTEKFSGVYKSVCAFSNSEGGIIIWGAPEGQDVEGRKEKIFVGALTHLDSCIEKDRLINLISSNVIPVANSINCEILTNGENKICIIEIQPSEYAPHQFQDKYFMRLDGQSRAAPHHYIEALFRKVKYPNLEGYLAVDVVELIPYPRPRYRVRFSVIIFNFSPLQNEELLSWRLICDEGFASHYDVMPISPYYYGRAGREIGNREAMAVFNYGQPYLYNTSFDIDPYYLESHNQEIEMILIFGGRFSPSKVSKYTLRVPRVNLPLHADYFKKNNPFKIIDENKLFHQWQNESGTSKEEQLTVLLGR